MTGATILSASGAAPPRAAIDRAADVLGSGGVVVVPTDTVYGLAVLAERAGATSRLFALKRRPPEVALPLLVADVDQARALADDDLPDVARHLMKRFWPGGLTVVVPRRPGLGLDLGGTDHDTVGVRLPAHPVPVALAARLGPLAVTSANLHGRRTPETAAEVVDELGDEPGLVLDGGRCAGAASTVVSCLGGEVRLLREGTVPFADIVASAAAVGNRTEVVDEPDEAPR